MAMSTSLECTAKIKPKFHEKLSKAIYGSDKVSWSEYFSHAFEEHEKSLEEK